MKPLAFAAFLISILLPSSAFSAHDTYEFFDLASCTHNSVEDDPLTGYKNYEVLVQQAPEWTVFHLDEERLGLCRQVSAENKAGAYSRRYSEIVCQQGDNSKFPLAGATFTLIKDNGSLPSYVCSKGCKPGVPHMIHDTGYEPPETWKNIEYEKQLRKFRRQCASKKR